MESASFKISRVTPTYTSRRPSKRLLFDRRYGWVFDEWKDPSEEALAGGRGMFCIVPLAHAFSKMASELMNILAISAVKVVEEGLSHRRLQKTSSSSVHTKARNQFGSQPSQKSKRELNYLQFIISRAALLNSEDTTESKNG